MQNGWVSETDPFHYRLGNAFSVQNGWVSKTDPFHYRVDNAFSVQNRWVSETDPFHYRLGDVIFWCGADRSAGQALDVFVHAFRDLFRIACGLDHRFCTKHDIPRGEDARTGRLALLIGQKKACGTGLEAFCCIY